MKMKIKLILNGLAILFVGFVLGVSTLTYINNSINDYELTNATIINKLYYNLTKKTKKEIANLIVDLECKQIVVDIKNRQMQLLRVENEALRYIINDDPKIKRLLKIKKEIIWKKQTL